MCTIVLIKFSQHRRWKTDKTVCISFSLLLFWMKQKSKNLWKVTCAPLPVKLIWSENCTLLVVVNPARHFSQGYSSSYFLAAVKDKIRQNVLTVHLVCSIFKELKFKWKTGQMMIPCINIFFQWFHHPL